jgi:2-polyprenyl-6-methoxyphenol hydroxylase-like FAD-dependent oxidoreductase
MVTLHLPPAHDIPGEVQVLIAGGGPSGLFLALDLAARGIPSTVIEPRDAVDHTRPRAKTTNARTMTHLRRLGLADALRAASPLPVDYAQDVIFCTGLTGPAAHELRRFRNAFQLVPGRYGLQPECGQQVPQPALEEVLRAAAADSPPGHLHHRLECADGPTGRRNFRNEAAARRRGVRPCGRSMHHHG